MKNIDKNTIADIIKQIFKEGFSNFNMLKNFANQKHHFSERIYTKDWLIKLMSTPTMKVKSYIFVINSNICPNII
jgi:hypothetical protein